MKRMNEKLKLLIYKQNTERLKVNISVTEMPGANTAGNQEFKLFLRNKELWDT
jgi:hypothetical protein